MDGSKERGQSQHLRSRECSKDAWPRQSILWLEMKLESSQMPVRKALHTSVRQNVTQTVQYSRVMVPERMPGVAQGGCLSFRARLALQPG